MVFQDDVFDRRWEHLHQHFVIDICNIVQQHPVFCAEYNKDVQVSQATYMATFSIVGKYLQRFERVVCMGSQSGARSEMIVTFGLVSSFVIKYFEGGHALKVEKQLFILYVATVKM